MRVSIELPRIGLVRRFDFAHQQGLADPLGQGMKAVDCVVRECSIEQQATASVAFGVSGLFGVVDPKMAALAFGWLQSCVAVQRVAVADDAVTAHAGALGGDQGVTVAVGTGCVAVAWDGERLRKVDGWGFAGGDRGSGYWIGSEGAAIALMHLDGRTFSPAIAEAFSRRYGSATEYARTTVLGGAPKGYIADFAADVADLAEAGDAHAREVIGRAAGYIASAVQSLWGEMSSLVALTGRAVPESGILRHLVEEDLESRNIRPTWVTPVGDPLAGAAWLARNPASAARWNGLLMQTVTEKEEKI